MQRRIQIQSSGAFGETFYGPARAEKLPLRAEASPTSKVVGFLEKGEVVAVTQVHNGNEMRIHRLRWCDSSLTRVLLRPVSMRVRTANRLDTLLGPQPPRVSSHRG